MNSQGLDPETERERERAQEEDEGRKERRSRARGERVRARCCGGVLSKALTPPLRPPTHLPARHQPYLTHSDTLFPLLRAPRLSSATHRLQSTAARVGECVCMCICVCILQQTLRCPSTKSSWTVLALNSRQAQPSIVHPLLSLGHILGLGASKFFPLMQERMLQVLLTTLLQDLLLSAL